LSERSGHRMWRCAFGFTRPTALGHDQDIVTIVIPMFSELSLRSTWHFASRRRPVAGYAPSPLLRPIKAEILNIIGQAWGPACGPVAPRSRPGAFSESEGFSNDGSRLGSNFPMTSKERLKRFRNASSRASADHHPDLRNSTQAARLVASDLRQKRTRSCIGGSPSAHDDKLN
jgi:hypothetical protein